MCPFSFYHNSRFRKPPCNPGRSDFPNPVLISAPQVIFQIMAFLYNPRIKCQLTYTQNHTVYQYPRFERQVHFIQFSDWLHIPYSKPPSTQSPFAQCGCYPSLGRLYKSPQKTLLFLHSSYGLMRQTVSLPASRFPLYAGSLQVGASPCWETVLPDIISAILA